jgi:hypothetical protein
MRRNECSFSVRERGAFPACSNSWIRNQGMSRFTSLESESLCRAGFQVLRNYFGLSEQEPCVYGWKERSRD